MFRAELLTARRVLGFAIAPAAIAETIAPAATPAATPATTCVVFIFIDLLSLLFAVLVCPAGKRIYIPAHEYFLYKPEIFSDHQSVKK
jgi:hypothetical protein